MQKRRVKYSGLRQKERGERSGIAKRTGKSCVQWSPGEHAEDEPR